MVSIYEEGCQEVGKDPEDSHKNGTRTEGELKLGAKPIITSDDIEKLSKVKKKHQ